MHQSASQIRAKWNLAASPPSQKEREREAYSKKFDSKDKIDFNKPKEAKQSYNKVDVPSYVTKASKK